MRSSAVPECVLDSYRDIGLVACHKGFDEGVASIVPERKAVNAAGSFSVGDRVRSANYGEGIIEAIENKENGNRVLTIKFPGRTARFIEAFAALEKL